MRGDLEVADVVDHDTAGPGLAGHHEEVVVLFYLVHLESSNGHLRDDDTASSEVLLCIIEGRGTSGRGHHDTDQLHRAILIPPTGLQ